MPKIFWKVFLWFWLTVVVAAAASFWLGDLWSERDEGSLQAAHLQSLVASADSILEERGVEALRPWLRYIRHRSPLRLRIVDMDRETSLRGRELHPHLREHLAAKPDRDGMIVTRFEDHMVISLPLESSRGGHFRLIGEPRIEHDRPPLRPGAVGRVAGSRLLIALVVTLLICLIIAYWLVRPIRQMQETARNFGEGNLSVRSSLGERRDEIGDLAREFDDMAERIELMMTSQQRLLRDVSHELRSPLARLQVSLELARNQSGKEQSAQFDRIAREAEQLDAMIGDMLALVRMESGEFSPAETMVSLDGLIETVVDDVNFEFTDQQKRARIVHAQPVNVKGDGTLLHSAVENVVRNAMKYTAVESEVEVSLSLSGTLDEESLAVIEVRDFGPGVPEESLPRLFEAFYRVGEARDRQSGGFGLGLSIASRVIHSHGGDISAQNMQEGGLKVRITLPVSGD